MRPSVRSTRANAGGNRTCWFIGGALGFLTVIAVRRLYDFLAIKPELRAFSLLTPLNMSAVTRPLFRYLLTQASGLDPPAGVHVSQVYVPSSDQHSIRVMIFQREGSVGLRPSLIWVHGGGYVVGTPEQDQLLISRILERLDIVIVSVDYRLAPEHPFPTPLDDCYAALVWLVNNAAKVGVDTHRVAIGGQSAGGGLAAALTHRVVDQGPITPVLQLLAYPMLDFRTTMRREHRDTGKFVWTPTSNRFGWKSYLGTDAGAGEYPPYAVPALRSNMSGMPQTWIGVGTLDLFYSEDIAYSNRLRQASVNCEVHVVERAYHGFDIFKPDAIATSLFLDSMLGALGRAFDRC